MTEDQIERRVERAVDHADRLFLAGVMTQEAYDGFMKDLNAWADAQYVVAAAEARAQARFA